MSQKEVVFTITGLTKTRKVNDKPLVLTFTECENEKLNVKTCILDYLERTRLLRENDTQFLISHVKPHKAIKACTISDMAETDVVFCGHRYICIQSPLNTRC